MNVNIKDKSVDIVTIKENKIELSIDNIDIEIKKIRNKIINCKVNIKQKYFSSSPSLDELKFLK